jgi:hypothetical protein
MRNNPDAQIDVPDDFIEAMLAKIDAKLIRAQQRAVMAEKSDLINSLFAEGDLYEINLLFQKLSFATRDRIGVDEKMNIRAEMQRICTEIVKQLLDAKDFELLKTFIETSYAREMAKTSLAELGVSGVDKVALRHARKMIHAQEVNAWRFDGDGFREALTRHTTLVDEVRALVAKAA